MEDGFDGYSPTPVIPPPPARPDVPVVTWRWWEAIVVFLIGQFLGIALASPALALHSHRVKVLVLALGAEAGLGLAVIAWLWFLHRRTIGGLGFPSRPGLEAGAGAIAGIMIYIGGVFVIGGVLSNLIRSASNKSVHAPRQLPTHLVGGQVALAAAAVVIAAPIAEELFFRGLLFRSLRARHGFVFAGAISAVVFGALHYQGQWQNGLLLSVVMCIVGFALAYLYERRGNIVANMAAHATFNVIGFVLIVTLNR